MATSSQETLSTFTAGTGTQSVTQTVVAPLETSNTKTAKVATAVEEFGAMCSYLGDMMASIEPHERTPNNPALYRLVTREFPSDERTVGSKVALAASRHVAATYQSYQAQHDGGERPSFGEETFFRLDNQSFEIVQNDRGFGVKARFIPYDPVWFHIDPRPYVRQYFERVCEGSASVGTAEFRLHDDGGVSLHLPVSWEVDVYEPGDVSTAVGVDIVVIPDADEGALDATRAEHALRLTRRVGGTVRDRGGVTPAAPLRLPDGDVRPAGFVWLALFADDTQAVLTDVHCVEDVLLVCGVHV